MKSKIHKNIVLLKWFNFFTDFRPYSAIAIIYFTQISGSYALGLTIFSIISISASIFEVPTGILSDHLGRKNTMIMGVLANILSLSLFYLANNYILLVGGAILAGIAETFYSGNNDALLYDSLREDGKEIEFPDYAGKLSSMFQLALAISAFLSGFIAEISFEIVFGISIIPQILCLIIALRVIEPKVHNKIISTNIFEHLKESLMEFKENKKLRLISFSSIIQYGIGKSIFQFTPAFFATLWPTWALGIARFLNHSLGFISFWFSGKIIKKLSAIKSLIISTIFGISTSIVAVIRPTIISPIFYGLGSLGFGLNITAENSLLQKEFTNHQRATLGSLNKLFGNLVFAISALILGTVADYIGPAKTILLGEILLSSVLILYFIFFKKYRL